MTARELMEQLRRMPPEAVVSVPNALQTGWTEARELRRCTMYPTDPHGLELSISRARGVGPAVEVLILE